MSSINFNLQRPQFFRKLEDVDESFSHAVWVDYPVRKRAAVLALITPVSQGSEDMAVLLTQRSMKLRVSPGDSAFPGGRVDLAFDGELGDDEWACALREAYEEIGFDPEAGSFKTTRLGIMPCYLSLGNDAVRVCVAHVETDSGGPVPLSELAPALASDEVDLAYMLALKQALQIKPWYQQQQSHWYHEWIFHKFSIPHDTTIELICTDTSGSPGLPMTLKGLTAHFVIDLARILYPDLQPEMEVLPFLGSNRWVRETLTSGDLDIRDKSKSKA